MDTMAWMPWIFLSTREILAGKPRGRSKLALFLVLQIFAGYIQIVFYTLLGALAYASYLKGSRLLIRFIAPLCVALLLSSCQWLPSTEYFFLHCVRHPAVPENPHFYLPLENLKTFFSFTALGKGGIPDYVISPTFFYFNFYSGFIPLIVLIWGFIRFKKLRKESRFFLSGFLL